eukprot:TRINITY_DN1541_c0_g1_i7.p1 TRINITY_DN1541_c0_g1~~TRINITY_DN1541_c0_g1_i7.p1  ORF type:complete len:318 (-),score=35.48 TRINITY_DN1541_c0_g1_i7:68-1021(-)
MSSKTKDYRSVNTLNSTGQALAAMNASLINTLISYPLDLVKTRFQVRDGIRTDVPKYKTTAHALVDIAKKEGFRGLYAGASSGVLGAAIAWSSYMYFYASIKDMFEEAGHELNTGHTAIASISGGIATMLITNPIWVIKTRLQLQFKSGPSISTNDRHYKSATDAFFRILREEGVRALYKGMVPGMLSTIHGFVQFASYEKLVSISLQLEQKDQISGYVSSVCGGVSKVLAQLVTYPFTVARSRLQDQRSGNSTTELRYKGFIDVMKKTAVNEGLYGFYKGLGPALWRMAMNSACFFFLFEKMKQMLEPIPYFQKEL